MKLFMSTDILIMEKPEVNTLRFRKGSKKANKLLIITP